MTQTHLGEVLLHTPTPQGYSGGAYCKVCGMYQVQRPIAPGTSAVAHEWKWPYYVCQGYREFKAQSVDLGGPWERHDHITLKLWPDGRVTWTE